MGAKVSCVTPSVNAPLRRGLRGPRRVYLGRAELFQALYQQCARSCDMTL
jgi:hypothetical protein